MENSGLDVDKIQRVAGKQVRYQILFQNCDWFVCRGRNGLEYTWSAVSYLYETSLLALTWILVLILRPGIIV